MARIIEEKCTARRVYLLSEKFGDPGIECVKEAGITLTYDREAAEAGNKGLWYCGAAKRAAIEKLLAEFAARPVIEKLLADFASKPVESKPEDVSRCRVHAKVKYKGRSYYVIAEAQSKGRCRVCTLDGQGPHRESGPEWVDMADCVAEKVYEGREHRGRMEYSTIGSLKKFRDSQRDAEKAGTPPCAACGRRSENLIEDMEDGLMKCRGCCDMPS